MSGFSLRALCAFFFVAIAGCSTGGSLHALPPSAGSSAERASVRHVCARPVAAGRRECDAVIRTDVAALTAYACGGIAAYCPRDLQAAYDVAQAAQTRGAGVTVAIVDAFGYPTAAGDLATYRSAMSLPPCTQAGGCLQIVNQNGNAQPLPGYNWLDDWRYEEALDLDMVSALCPNCRIVLVQANSNGIADLDAAENTAIALGAQVVSNSFGGPEFAASDAAFDHPGHAIVASAGDSGAEAEQPCSFATVVCVGGTQLQRSSDIRGWGETAWGGTGSGCSRLVRKPAWQTDRGCPRRSESDISAEASPLTPVAVYITGGWVPMGGTSAAAPIVAALFALAGNASSIDAPQWVWQHGGAGAFNDVVQGSNPGRFHCPRRMYYLCDAGPGYDGPTGWGTPNGLGGL